MLGLRVCDVPVGFAAVLCMEITSSDQSHGDIILQYHTTEAVMEMSDLLIMCACEQMHGRPLVSSLEAIQHIYTTQRRCNADYVH